MTDAEKFAKFVETSKKNWGETPHVIDGVEFWQVGRNASHEFYLARVGNFILRYACGEGWDDEGNDILDEGLNVCKSFDELNNCYLGHL